MALRIAVLGAPRLSLPFFEGPILALETSCDETSAAVLTGRRVLSNVISSQVKLHEKWGGIVPEAAARAHVEAVLPVIEEALAIAGVVLEDLKGIAVSNRPGLVGALSVGVTAAKGLSFALRIPMVGVHHLEGHLFSVYGSDEDVLFPHVALIVSGGHTELVLVSQAEGCVSYELVGQTRDDAAGEAFDKTARLLGLGYPGGNAVQEAAKGGDPKRYSLPRGLQGNTTDFSFSGLKTAILRLVQSEGAGLSVADACASLQEAIVSVLVERAMLAVDNTGSKALTLVGGVAANVALRTRLAERCLRDGIQFLCPPLDLCTDNAAMIGLAGSYRLAMGDRDDWTLDCMPNAALP